MFVSTSCDFSPTIYLDGGIPLRFHFGGRDYVDFLVVTENCSRKPKCCNLWKIADFSSRRILRTIHESVLFLSVSFSTNGRMA